MLVQRTFEYLAKLDRNPFDSPSSIHPTEKERREGAISHLVCLIGVEGHHDSAQQSAG